MATSFRQQRSLSLRIPPSILRSPVRRPPSVLSDPSPEADLVGLQDAASYLDVSIDRLVGLAQHRRILHYEIASVRMFDPIELARWVTANRI